MERRRQILEQIHRQFPFGVDQLSEDVVLAEVGLNSLHLITALLDLQRHYGLPDEWIARSRMPRTVGELVTLVERELVSEPFGS